MSANSWDAPDLLGALRHATACLRADVDEVYDHVTATMQETLDALAAERRLPIIG